MYTQLLSKAINLCLGSPKFHPLSIIYYTFVKFVAFQSVWM